MKWPNSLTFIRHGESAYNYLKIKKQENPDYKKFCEIYDRDFNKAEDENWPSEELKELAKKIWQTIKLGVSDYNTPLTEKGINQAKETGSALKKKISLPDIIYASPYLRTRQTLAGIMDGWPELKEVKVIYEERIREQEHGIGTVFNDWRIYYTLNPIQGLLFKLEGNYEYRFLNGENKADVRDRVRSFFSTLTRENVGQNILVISHHLTLLCLRANLERWDREKFIEVDDQEKPINCGVTIYKGITEQGKDGKLILETYNQKLYK
jgi:broad specificity phosphatase PhoE